MNVNRDPVQEILVRKDLGRGLELVLINGHSLGSQKECTNFTVIYGD